MRFLLPSPTNGDMALKGQKKTHTLLPFALFFHFNDERKNLNLTNLQIQGLN